MKILAVLAAVAGVVYIIATFGDKIVAWAKKLLKSCGKCCCDDDCCCEDECCCEDDCCCEKEDCCEAAVEEAPAEEAPAAEEADFEA